MKKIIRLLFLASFALLQPLCATAQEFIKEPIHLKKNRSIIREISRENWLVYSEYDYFAWFSWITENGIFFDYTVSSNWMDALIISDIEILDRKIVYYCGIRHNMNSNTRKGVFGYFDLSSFTTGSSYNEVELPTQLINDNIYPEKIDIYTVGDTVHLVMVANTPMGGGGAKPHNGTIIEAISQGLFPASWDIYYAQNSTLRYDDIAVTENYVVATARNTSTNAGYTVSFNKSTTSSSFIPLTSPYTHPHSAYFFHANDTILIEACEHDYYATVTYSNDIAPNGAVAVYAHNPTGLYATIYMPPLPGVDPLLQVRDIKYNPYRKTLNLLQHFKHHDTITSAIFHLDTTLANPANYPTSVLGHAYYNKHKLSSIDRLLYKPNHIIASGHSTNPEWHLLFIYQIREDLYGHCTDSITNTCNTIDKKTVDVQFDFITNRLPSDTILKDRYNGKIKIENICE